MGAESDTVLPIFVSLSAEFGLNPTLIYTNTGYHVTFTLEMRASISVNSIHSFDQNTDADIAISHAKETEGKIKVGKHYSHV